LFPLFATGVIDNGGKFASGVVDTGGKLPPVSLNLPPVSTTLVKLVAKFATGVVDTGGAPLLANISANFRKNSKGSQWDTLGLVGN
jgi:hypothetical protein